jgi:D-alanyl-lipoteichoic acid acyltransferase DltB (MBOAT superfamily)
MRGSVIALNATSFWVLCGLAVLMMVPLRSASMRKWVLFGLNLAFVGVLLGRSSLGLLAAVVVAYLLLQAVGRGYHRALFAIALFATVLMLFVLHKLPNVSDGLGLEPVTRVMLLIGYSYVALRLTEALRAVFEKRHSPPDFPSTFNYLLPFHMLAAGPIQSYDDYSQQPTVPVARSAGDILLAIDRITAGLFKKFVLAFALQKLFLTDFQAHGMYRVLEVQVFFIWLYLDFSAYSDIAVGIGALIGVVTPENFNRPLLARNMIDFWDRWHISLSLFVRRNLFIPLQLRFMRATEGGYPLLCAIAATTLSFVAIGLWHALTVGFLAWGFAQALGIVVVRVYGQFLQRRLGTKGVKRYLANPWIRMAAVFVTFEFEATTLLTLFMS